MRMKANNYFLKNFEEMNLINRRFNVYDNAGNLLFENCYINKNGYVCYDEDDRELWAITMELLTGKYSYEIIPHKKKLRDLTKDEWDKWKRIDCDSYDSCDNCLFKNIACSRSYSGKSWFNNKDLYSDKFLDQEIEVEE